MKSKTEVVAAIANSTDLSKECVRKVLDSFAELALEELSSDDDAKVLLPGVGTLRKSFRAERQGRNPATGKELTIAAAYVPSLKFGKAFKDGLNN